MASSAEMISTSEGKSVQIRTARNDSMARVVQQFAGEDGYADEDQINNAYEYIKKSKMQKLKLRRTIGLLAGTVIVLLIAIGVMQYFLLENAKESHIQSKNANSMTTLMTSVNTGMPVTTGRTVYDGGSLLKVLDYNMGDLSSVERIDVPVLDTSNKPMYYSNKIEGYLIKDNVLNFFMGTAGHILKISCQKDKSLCSSKLEMDSVEYNVTSTDFDPNAVEAGTVLYRLLDTNEPATVPGRRLLQRKVSVMGVLVFYTGGTCYVETQASDGRTISYKTDIYWCKEANLVTAQPVYTPPREETGCYVQTRSYGGLQWYTCNTCKSWYGSWFTCKTKANAYYGR